jgi:hypothetical protein
MINGFVNQQQSYKYLTLTQPVRPRIHPSQHHLHCQNLCSNSIMLGTTTLTAGWKNGRRYLPSPVSSSREYHRTFRFHYLTVYTRSVSLAIFQIPQATIDPLTRFFASLAVYRMFSSLVYIPVFPLYFRTKFARSVYFAFLWSQVCGEKSYTCCCMSTSSAYRKSHLYPLVRGSSYPSPRLPRRGR